MGRMVDVVGKPTLVLIYIIQSTYLVRSTA